MKLFRLMEPQGLLLHQLVARAVAEPADKS
jgi:hypothetical protein